MIEIIEKIHLEHKDSKTLNDILNIWLNTNIEEHSYIDSKYWKSNYELVKELLPKADVYIYSKNNQIVGFLGIVNNSYIAGIFIIKEYQNIGIGKKLIDTTKNFYDSLELSVYKKNSRAVNFYQRNGFLINSESLDEETDELEYEMIWKK